MVIEEGLSYAYYETYDFNLSDKILLKTYVSDIKSPLS
jgi:hypothetical protein